MDTSLSALMGLLRLTLSDPRGAARRVMALPLPLGARWQALALVIVLSMLFGQAAALMLAGEGVDATALGLIQAAALLTLVYAVYIVGRLMGGRGVFEDGLILVAWLQGVMVAVQLAQIVALLILPPLTGLLGFLGFALFLWLLTNFVAELHGFSSLGRVFGMILLTLFGVAIVLAIVLQMLGITPPGGMTDV